MRFSLPEARPSDRRPSTSTTQIRRLDRAAIVVDTTADAQGLVCAIRSTSDAGVLSVLDLVATGVFDPRVVPFITASFDDAAAWLQPAAKLMLTRSGG